MNLTREQIRIYNKIEKTKKIINQHENMVKVGKEYLWNLEVRYVQIIGEMKRVLDTKE